MVVGDIMNNYQKLYYRHETERLEYVGICDFCKKDIFLYWDNICIGAKDDISYHIECFHTMIYQEGG